MLYRIEKTCHLHIEEERPSQVAYTTNKDTAMELSLPIQVTNVCRGSVNHAAVVPRTMKQYCGLITDLEKKGFFQNKSLVSWITHGQVWGSIQVDPKTSMQAVPCHIQKVQQGQKIENAPNNSAFLLEGRLTGLTSDQEFLLFSASRGSSNYGYT